MNDDNAKRARMLLSAPEIDDEVVALMNDLGPEGAKAVFAAARDKEKALPAKERAHAVELLARAGEIEDTDLHKLAADSAPTVRRHALLALQDRRRTDLLLESLQHKELDATDHAIVLQALARIGNVAQVKGTLEWAVELTDPDIRNLAATALRTMRNRPEADDDIDDLDRLVQEFRQP